VRTLFLLSKNLVYTSILNAINITSKAVFGARLEHVSDPVLNPRGPTDVRPRHDRLFTWQASRVKWLQPPSRAENIPNDRVIVASTHEELEWVGTLMILFSRDTTT